MSWLKLDRRGVRGLVLSGVAAGLATGVWSLGAPGPDTSTSSGCPRWSHNDPCRSRKRVEKSASLFSSLANRGPDDRVDIECLPEVPPETPSPRTYYRAIPALFPVRNLETLGDGSFRVASPALADYEGDERLCDDEVFAHQPRGAHCGAALVAPRTVVAAAHCISSGQLPEYSVVFDFIVRAGDPASLGVIAADSVCWPADEPRLVIEGKLAIFDIKCPEGFVEPPVLTVADLPPREGELVYGIGYPQKLPAKFTGFEPVRRFGADGAYRYFTADLDLFPGNSGSPILDLNHKLVGIAESDASSVMCDDIAQRCRRWAGCAGSCGSDVKITPVNTLGEVLLARTRTEDGG